MNMRVASDTHSFVKRLEAAGVSVAHAEALADALGDIVLPSIATKTDLRELELSLQGGTREAVTTLRGEMKEVELRLMVRMGAMLAASTALTVAVLGVLISFH
jgi:hypothetical protein